MKVTGLIVKDEKVLLVGDGQHASVCLEVLNSLPVCVVRFDQPPSMGSMSELLSRCAVMVERELADSIVVGIGKEPHRSEICHTLSNRFLLYTLIATTAYVSPSANISKGCQIFHGAFIGTNVRLGSNVIVNTGCIVEHDSFINSNTQLAPGVVLGGGVSIGKNNFLGAGALVRDHITICDNTEIGMGAVVTKSIFEPGKYFGAPARLVK